MSRVEINSGGRQIIVDHDGPADLAYMIEKAKNLWMWVENEASGGHPAAPDPGRACVMSESDA